MSGTSRLVAAVAVVAAGAAGVVKYCPFGKHTVTRTMLRDAGEEAGRPAPPFVARGGDGATYSLATLTRGTPLALVFIKDGCPCSVAAEPYFQRLYHLYRGRLRLVGVIDGDAAVARAWAREQKSPYPILTDPDLAIARAYGAKGSAYVALVTPAGRVERLWPGYSQSMLRQLGARAAALAGVAERPFDAAGAPAKLFAGCRFLDLARR